MNSERDEKSPSYGLFMDDDINEEHKVYGFFEDDLEKISQLVDEQPDDIKEEKEHFGFFDDMPSISPDSIMKSNDIENNVVITPTVEIKQEITKEVPRKVKALEQEEENKKSIANNTTFNFFEVI